MRAAALLALPFAGLAAQVWRYAHADAEARRQTRLVVVALGTLVLAFAVLAVLDPELEQGVGDLVVTTPRLQALYELQLLLVLTAALFLLPISIAVSGLRYRLLDIDIVVNRAVIYGLLAAFIGAVYITVVVVVGAAVGSTGEPNAGLAILTLAIVAFSVDAVRRRAEQFANQLVYGDRARPYELLAAFSHGLSRAVSGDDVLPRVAEAAARGTGGVAGRARLRLEGDVERISCWPDDAAADLAFAAAVPITFHGEEVGGLEVAARRGEPPTEDDRAVLQALAEQAAPALHNLALDVRLEASAAALSAQTEELQASRRRIVTAREDAVRSLVANVEERVEQALVDARRALVATATTLRSEPAAALDRVNEAATLVRTALDALRDIAHGVYPRCSPPADSRPPYRPRPSGRASTSTSTSRPKQPSAMTLTSRRPCTSVWSNRSTSSSGRVRARCSSSSPTDPRRRPVDHLHGLRIPGRGSRGRRAAVDRGSGRCARGRLGDRRRRGATAHRGAGTRYRRGLTTPYASAVPETPAPPGRVRRFAELVALSGIIVAEPVLTALHEGADVFVSRRAQGWHIVALTLLIRWAPRSSCFVVEELVGLWRRGRLRDAAHRVFLGGLGVLVVIRLLG